MDNEIKILLKAVKKAGVAILSIQETGFSISKKANDDIVTKADLVANDILRAELMRAFPQDGWLSEETVDDKTRLNASRVWIVDPIDGTREFASGIAEYAISVALVEQGKPILSAVFNPATNELFHAINGKGAFLNENRIFCEQDARAESLLLLASRSESKRGEWEKYRAQHQIKEIGSIAYKMALIAAGQGHATFSLGQKNEWDIAAGTLLVTEAGGLVTNKHQQSFIFNQEKVKVDGIVATTSHSQNLIFNLISHTSLGEA